MTQHKLLSSTGHPPFASSVLPWTGVLHRRALSLCRDADLAQDLVQDTVLRAYRYWPSFRHGGDNQLGAWLRRILTNTFINSCRGEARRRRLEESLRDTQSPEVVDGPALDEVGFGDEVRDALAQLRPEFRQVLLLVDVEQLSYAEAAEQLGCPIGTVMSRLHRARAAMRNTLAEYAVSEGCAPPA